MSITGSSSGDAWKTSRSSWTWTSSPQSVGGRDGRRLEGFAEMREDFPDRPRLRNERDQPDVAAARRTLKRKLLPHPGHEFRPGNPGGVVRAGVLMRVRAASRGVTVAPMPAGRGVTPLADVADRECRDAFPQPVVRRNRPMVAMAVLPRRRDEIGEPVEELIRRELDDAARSRPRGVAAAAGPDPSGGFVPGQHGADARDPAVCTRAAGHSIGAGARDSENSTARRGR